MTDINLFTDLFNAEGERVHLVRYQRISTFHKIHFALCCLLIFAIMLFFYADNGFQYIKSPDMITIQDVYINDHDAGKEFIEYLKEHAGKNGIVIEDLHFTTYPKEDFDENAGLDSFGK